MGVQRQRPSSRQLVARRKGDAVTASDSFEKLKKQVDDAERAISAAVTEDEAKVGAKLDQARSSAEDRAAELRARTQEASDKAEDHWHEIQA
jgi:hypothetical protein